jgi:acetylornithine deacetylase
MMNFPKHERLVPVEPAPTLPRSSTLSRILDLSMQLISIPSVTGEERHVMEFMETELAKRGWNVERWPTSEPTRWNVFATAVNPNPSIVFTSHLDVVPAIDPKQFQPVVTETHLIGRGACDTKGIVGCMIEACDNLRANGADDIGLLFVVDEEKVSIGAKAAAPILQQRGVRYVINGEPSDGKLVSYQKGVFSGLATFKGYAYHSGYPELGVDANLALIKFCNALLSTNFASHPTRGETTINFGKINGGQAGNIVSASAEVDFWIRTIGPSAEFEPKIRSLIDSVAQEVPRIETSFQVRSCTDPFEPIVLPGFETIVFKGGTDLPHLVKYGPKGLMLGPGSIHDAHTRHEKIAFSELEQAFTSYQKLYYLLRNNG